MYYLFCFYLDQSRLVLFPLDYVLYILEGFLFLMLMEYPFFGSYGHKNFGFFFFPSFLPLNLLIFFVAQLRRNKKLKHTLRSLGPVGMDF